MRPDIEPGAVFPDYELPDHTNATRQLSELLGEDPLILTLTRGHYCPKEHQQHQQLAMFFPQVAVAYTQMVTISTDEHHELQKFRASLGAQWTFLSDPGRIVQQDLDIQEYTDPRARPDDPAHRRARARARDPQRLLRILVLGTPVGRGPPPRPASRLGQDPSRLGSQHAGAARRLGVRRPVALPRLEQVVARTRARRDVTDTTRVVVNCAARE